MESNVGVGHVTEDQMRYCSPWSAAMRGGAQSGGNRQNIMVDPNSQTRWKHKWRMRSGTLEDACGIRDKMASAWAGAEDWRSRWETCQTVADKRDFVTFSLMNVKHHAQTRNWRLRQTH